MTPIEIARLLAKIQTRSIEECALADLHVCATEPNGIKGEQQTVCSVCNCPIYFRDVFPANGPQPPKVCPKCALAKARGEESLTA